ncbi:hypothetical protein C7446_2910 [Kushneria sinocarnis]|uniref:Retropepsin-like aspartic endopeptidase domain-containing protein n=1 Tax=Kushneria sinocarnis TaxID=595502 RepID=A0A420WTD2_9GAMM|nr:RimK/LysX family protein [Kushneria sinocarnis]RKQ96318.1 hypothetical protein C7446_2910 [Kushneria sinocarnis]
MTPLPYEPRAILGRREMIELPELSLRLACKIDTGARTSALHAERIELIEESGAQWIEFDTWTGDDGATSQRFRLPFYDRRRVRSSNGHIDWRHVIRTPIQLGEMNWEIELTLVDRSRMRHPMLLGRRAMRRMLVAPGASFLHGAP